MKQVGAVLIFAVLLSGRVMAEEQPRAMSDREKLSYSIGMDIGRNLKRQSIDIDPAALAEGLGDVYLGKETRMTDDEMRSTLMEFQKAMMEKQQEQMKAAMERNRKIGELFLADNAKKEGVVTLPSGLQYRIIEEGTGKSPDESSMVTVHYRGTLVDGTEFDSSHRRGQPATFAVNGVIKGWTEALQLMKEGAKWQLVIPPDLGYGERGAGNQIGPNAVLIFDVELLSVQDAPASHAPVKTE